MSAYNPLFKRMYFEEGLFFAYRLIKVYIKCGIYLILVL